MTNNEDEYFCMRKKKIDDSDHETRVTQLGQIAPWLPQFTPTAPQTEIKVTAKRPSSPFSGNPLRVKDLIPIDLMTEEAISISDIAGPQRFVCPVSRKTITTQKVILIKSTGTYMLQSVAAQLAYPSMLCPITSKKFTMDQVIELVPASSGFAATGNVESSKYRPSMS